MAFAKSDNVEDNAHPFVRRGFRAYDAPEGAFHVYVEMHTSRDAARGCEVVHDAVMFKTRTESFNGARESVTAGEITDALNMILHDDHHKKSPRSDCRRIYDACHSYDAFDIDTESLRRAVGVQHDKLVDERAQRRANRSTHGSPVRSAGNSPLVVAEDAFLDAIDELLGITGEERSCNVPHSGNRDTRGNEANVLGHIGSMLGERETLPAARSPLFD